MPVFDLRGILVAKYGMTSNGPSYTNRTKVGDAMSVNIELRSAEGRLYAESSLAEYMRKCVGGIISVGVKYIKNDAQKIMFGLRDKKRSITYTPEATEENPNPQPVTKEITSVVTGGKTQPNPVGTAFYAPDMIDGVAKFTCIFISRTIYGQPSMTFQTATETIQFNTPTTTGEFMNNGTKTLEMVEVAVVDSEEEAIAWTEGVLS